MQSLRGRSVLLGVASAAIAGAFVACGGNSTTASAKPAQGNPTPENTAARVTVTMKEWSIDPVPVTVKAGEVRFFVSNRGQAQHELVVVKSDKDPAKLPVYGPGDTLPEGHGVGDVNEDEVTSEGEIEEIDIGGSKDATFVLGSGKYVLICNLPSHYSQGMRVSFTVR